MKSFLFFCHLKQLIKNIFATQSYSAWIQKIEQVKLQEVVTHISKKEGKILVTFCLILKPSDRLDEIKHTIGSLQRQTNTNWHLLVLSSESIVDSLPNDSRIKNEQYESSLFQDQVKYVTSIAEGMYLTFIDAGDLVSSHAVNLILDCAPAKIIYTDEDSLNSDSIRQEPIFKPDWNPDYLNEYNYFLKAVIYDVQLLLIFNDYNFEGDDPQYELVLKATRQVSANDISHIDFILFHFKKLYRPSVKSRNINLEVKSPLVSIIVPSRDQSELLRTCIRGILGKTDYPNLEILIIDNNSKEKNTLNLLSQLSQYKNLKIIKYKNSFNFSDMNNIAVEQSQGSLICFLNNDIEITNNNWLKEMVFHACRPEIGCVGAKLFYPDGTIQHGGVILGLKGYASHAHKGFAGDAAGYGNRLIVTHNVSAVTAACMVMRKSVFEEVGGFDAENLKVAYNDVDLCLKVRDAGYRNLFTPHAQLIHHESKSRGKKRNRKQQKQLKQESEYLLKRWGDVLFSDPAYNKNLTLLREDFSLGFDRKHTTDE